MDKDKKKRLISIIAAIPILVLLFMKSNSNKPVPYQKMEGSVFATIYHITYQSKDDYQQEVLEEFRTFDKSLSMFNKQSLITQFNNNDTTARADQYFKSLYETAVKVSDDTNGAFDITVAPLVNLWGFGFKNKDNVTAEAIDSIRQFVGYQRIALHPDGRLEKQDPRVMLDASSIAKGYACDVIAQLLESKGVSNYMVEIGGEIALKGISPKGQPWRVGINKPEEDPESTNQEILAVLNLTKGGVATSGNYRKFYYKDGKRFAHTICPQTGYPVQQDILSSTVIGPNCMTADAYATAFMVLGTDESLKVLERNPDLMAYFITENRDSTSTDKYSVYFTPSLQEYLKNNNK